MTRWLPFAAALALLVATGIAYGIRTDRWSTSTELRDMVRLLQREKIKVVFTEETFPTQMLRVLRDEAGVKVYIISHIASGPFTADRFERDMQINVDTMIRALVTES